MQTRAELVIRNVHWGQPGRGTVHDYLLAPPSTVTTHMVPSIGGGLVDEWQLQDLVMCPGGGTVVGRPTTSGYEILAAHTTHIQSGRINSCEIRQESPGVFFLYTHWVMFSPGGPSGLGCCAFLRAAQTAHRLGLTRIELLAAGGTDPRWTSKFNGYYSWPKFGFDAPLEPAMMALVAKQPHLAHCMTVQEVISADSVWWKSHGNGCEMTFDLASGSKSWQTLHAYIRGRKLVV